LDVRGRIAPIRRFATGPTSTRVSTYRYIYAGGKLDGIPTYWTYHRDYPEGDARSLHVFGDDTLTLKARIPVGGGLWPRGIESGILRAKLPITPSMYVEMRAKLPYGLGSWPAFWLNAGVQYDNGTFSELPWPPEIDIFEFFNWQGRNQTRVMTGNVQTHGKPERFGSPHDIWTKFVKGEYTRVSISPRTFTSLLSTGARMNPSGCSTAFRSNKRTTSGAGHPLIS